MTAHPGGDIGNAPTGTINQRIAAQRPAELNEIPALARDVDVEALITIRTMADVEDRRSQLIDHLWKGEGLPADGPQLDVDVVCPELAALGAPRIDRLIQPLPVFGAATSYLVHPEHPAAGHRLGIYLSGHGDPRSPKYHQPQLAAMRAMLDRGYHVGSVDMPFMGWNTESTSTGSDRPPSDWPTDHEILGAYETPTRSTARMFLDPAITMINELTMINKGPLDRVVAVGFSGGSWTTTLLAAVDPRVTLSVQVAGSCPFYLRPYPAWKPNFGDWEQRRESQPELYAIAGYLDLYTLGAAGQGRRQVQITNRYDPSCFPGLGHLSYAAAVGRRAGRLGGSWASVDDATHGLHQVSPHAINHLGWELDRLEHVPADQFAEHHPTI